jgi:hypothetical protein
MARQHALRGPVPLGSLGGERRRAAPPADAAQQLLALHPQIGNRAVSQLLQRDVDDVLDVLGGPAMRITEAALQPMFDAAVRYGRSTATPFEAPDWYTDALRDYAFEHPQDAPVLWAGWMRRPRFHVGGLVPSDAHAMTMDLDVFCNGPPNVGTWIHELVHVAQYGSVGPTRFLINMLGSESAAVLVKLVRGEKFDLFKNSAYEVEGYSLERRYWEWTTTGSGKDYPVGPEGPVKRKRAPPETRAS